jgi:hypothetical protein
VSGENRARLAFLTGRLEQRCVSHILPEQHVVSANTAQVIAHSRTARNNGVSFGKQ